MMLIKADIDGKEVTTIVQNAETIRLTSPDGEPLSVVSLKKETKCLCLRKVAEDISDIKLKKP